MIWVSLENGWMGILDRRKIHTSLPLIMPLVLEINKVVGLLNKTSNVNCNVNIKIGNAMNLEVKND